MIELQYFCDIEVQFPFDVRFGDMAVLTEICCLQGSTEVRRNESILFSSGLLASRLCEIQEQLWARTASPTMISFGPKGYSFSDAVISCREI